MSDPNTPDSLWLRLLWLLIIAAMMSVAQTLVSLLTLVQLIIMATNKRQPNAEIAAFGKRLGAVAGPCRPFPNRRDRRQALALGPAGLTRRLL